MRLHLFLPLAILAALFIPAAIAADAPVEIPIELSKPLPPPANGNLGTRGYPPTEKETPFLKKVQEKPFDPFVEEPAPATQGAASRPKPGRLAAMDGKYVGWFGIVRKNTWDDTAKKSTLLLQHQYFDGLTDIHLQVVSCNGAGDFTVVASQKLDTIPTLALVRVYGKVSLDKDKNAVITPEYIRVWDWPLFTFMDYGTDHSNPDWVKLRKVDGLHIYSSRPNNTFYEQRLGKR